MNAMDPKQTEHREEKFPKTMTIPEGWNTENIIGHRNGKDAPNGSPANGNIRPAAAVSDDELLNRRLEPFPRPNTIPSDWDLSAF